MDPLQTEMRSHYHPFHKWTSRVAIYDDARSRRWNAANCDGDSSPTRQPPPADTGASVRPARKRQGGAGAQSSNDRREVHLRTRRESAWVRLALTHGTAAVPGSLHNKPQNDQTVAAVLTGRQRGRRGR